MEDQPRVSAPPRADDVISDERFERYHRFAREKGTSRVLYYLARVHPAAGVPDLVPPAADRTRARPRAGRPDRRLQPPQLPRPLRDRRVPALAAPPAVRRQGRAVREALAGLAALTPRRLPDSPRPVRRDRDRHRAADRRARRHRDHLSRGHPDPDRVARAAEARRRPAGARDRRPGAADRRHGIGGGPPRLEDPPEEGPAAGRQGDHLPADRSARRRRSPRRSPTGSGPTSSCNGSGSAACRRCARRR